MSYPRRPTSSEHPYAPPTSSPLSPHSAPPPPSEPSVATTNSHYYRPLRSSLTSPARSNISSPAHSPTRPSRQSRIQSLLATDPLLSHLTPVTIARLSTSGDFDFKPGEKEWSLRAVEGTVKVNEWLREVEGWNREWRRSYRENKDAGDGYLPPTDRPKKRRKTDMGSIREEEEDTMLDGSKPVRRRLFSENNGAGRNEHVIAKDDTGLETAETLKPQTDSPSLGRGGKPLTPYQLKIQRQRAAEARKDLVPVDGASEPDQAPVEPVEKIDVREGEEEDQDDELEEGVEYWGSLRRSVVEGYEARIEAIKSEIEELDVDGLKDRVLSYRTGTANPLTDSSAILAATTLQLLPPLARLTKLLSIWAVRIAVLRVVPVFLRWLQIAKDALDAGYTAINHPSINPESGPLDTDWRGLEEESYTLMQETITQKVATAGRLMDTMLDALEGREDVLPEKWIVELEDVEEGVGRWEMDGERVVLEGRLRLEEMRMRQSRREEEAREREKTLLVLEQERSAQEARVEEEAAMDVMEKAEETDRQLREALETNDIVAEAIELPDDDENDWIEPDTARGDIEELLLKLEDVEKERSLSEEDEDRGRRSRRARSISAAHSPRGVDNHRDPPEPPSAIGPLVVEEDQNEPLPAGESEPLTTATNGTFFSRLFSAVPRAPLRKANQASEGACSLPAVVSSTVSEGPAVNVSATLPEETARPQLSQQRRDEDERIRMAVSQQMEQNLSQGRSARSEPRTSSPPAHMEEQQEEKREKEKQLKGVEEAEEGEDGEDGEDGERREGKNEPQVTFADDEAIRLNIVQQMEQMMIGDSGQSQQVEAGAISVTPVPEPAWTAERSQSQPQTSSALPTEADEQIRQRITQDMEQSLVGTGVSQLEQKKEVVESSQPVVASQPNSSTMLGLPVATIPKLSRSTTEDDEIRRKPTTGMVQSMSTGSMVQPEIKRESQQISQLTSVQPVAVPVVGAISAQQSHAQVDTPQDDEAIRRQIQKGMQRLLESGGTLSTSTAVVTVDKPAKESAQEPVEEKSPFSTPPRSVRHPSPPIIGDDDQIRRKIVTEMEQFVNKDRHVLQAAAPSGSIDLESQQCILQPEPRSIIAPAGGNEDEQIRQQIVRQMEEMMIHDTAPAADEPALQEPVSRVLEAAQQALPVPCATCTTTTPAPQVIYSDDDERIRRKVVEEMETLLRGGSMSQQSQPATVKPTIQPRQATAQPAPILVQPTHPETPADDEKIKQRVTAEMEESLKKERSPAAECTGGESGAQQAVLRVESEKRVDGKWEAEAERQRLAHEQAERERITKLAEAEKTPEAEARKAAVLEAQRLAAEEELAEKARLELEAEKVAETERLLLAEEAAEKEKAAELERLAEAERQRLDAQRHEEETAAAKALEERRAAEAERAAVVEAARQVFISGQAKFDDNKFQELDRQRRLAEDERVRLADVALAEREKAREARQQAERVQREREIEVERVKAETLRQRANNALGADASDTGTEGFRGIETGSTATVEDDLTSDVFDTAAESDGSGDDLDYSDIWKAQTGYETPRAIQEPEDILLGEVSRSLESVMATPESPAPSSPMHIDQPTAAKLPSPPNSDDQDYKLSGRAGIKPSVEMPSNLAHVWEQISETSFDIGSSGGGGNEDEDGRGKGIKLTFDKLLIADNSADEHVALDSGEPEKSAMGCEDVLAVDPSELLPPETFVEPKTPAKGLGNIPNLSPPGQYMFDSPEGSRSQEDFRHFDDEDFLLSRGYSFDTPSIILAPSTPQKGNTPQKGDSLEHSHDEDSAGTPRRGVSPQSPDSQNGSFGISLSRASMGEGDQADMSGSMSYFEQEESSEIEIKPVATSTPKGNRRLTVTTGLDSIVEVLTPRSTRGQRFDDSDRCRNDSPGLDGFSGDREGADSLGDGVFSSPIVPDERVEKEMLPIELSEKVAEREIWRDPTRATSASKNRSVPPRSSTPTFGKGLAKDQKQRFTLCSSSSAPSATTEYRRPTSRVEARPSSRQGNRPSSRAQEYRPPSRARDTGIAGPSPRAGLSTPGGAAGDGSNSSTPTGTPAPAIRPMRGLRRDTVSTTGADSDEDDDPRRFLRENTPEMLNSPDFVKAPKLQVTKRHVRQPSNFTSTVTPEKSSRSNKGPHVAQGSSLVLPTTPILQVDLDDKINEILGSLPSKVRLTASNLQKLSESTKRQPPIKPFDLSSPTGIPGPGSVGSSPSIASEVPSYARASARRHNSSSPGDIKLYHLHRTDGQAPIKLYIRLVGENGERVMVRVGGGWADLAEYLKEYATHHGSKRRVVSEGRVEIQDLSTHTHHGRTLHPSRSISSFRSVSPGPMGSRPSSPLPGGNRPSTSLSMRRPESPMLMKRSESENPSLHTNSTTMRGGHNGTLSRNSRISPTTPPDETFPPQPVTAVQLTPPNRNSPPGRPASRPGSSSSVGYRRPTSRLSFSESVFGDSGSVNGYSPPSLLPQPQPLGLAGPKGKNVHPDNQAWVEDMLGQVRKASADRRTQLLAAAAGHYGDGGVDEVAVEGSVPLGGGGGQGGDYSGREFGGKLGEIGKVGGTRRLFVKRG
ncbi:unnamed protein product [Tuber aestivum]|uniref:GAR domain-containing protein n=1 Tax=Tuber aestivum TaxID=59557 RepID=A0A292PML0_9PEZI|nr:unnamed protein product [Tuber aestivum]